MKQANYSLQNQIKSVVHLFVYPKLIQLFQFIESAEPALLTAINHIEKKSKKPPKKEQVLKSEIDNARNVAHKMLWVR